MDLKCVRVLRPYENEKASEPTIYIDEATRYSLNKQWGQKVEASGRRKIEAIIKPLKALDADGYIASADQKVIDALYIEYGEEIMLH